MEWKMKWIDAEITQLEEHGTVRKQLNKSALTKVVEFANKEKLEDFKMVGHRRGTSTEPDIGDRIKIIYKK